MTRHIWKVFFRYFSTMKSIRIKINAFLHSFLIGWSILLLQSSKFKICCSLKIVLSHYAALNHFIPLHVKESVQFSPHCSHFKTCPHWCKSSSCFSTRMTFIIIIIAIPWIVAVPYTVYRPPQITQPFRFDWEQCRGVPPSAGSSVNTRYKCISKQYKCLQLYIGLHRNFIISPF